MAAECLGTPFSHKRFRKVVTIDPQSNEVVWVKQRYTPKDLRNTTPVQRWKFMVTSLPQNFSQIPDGWKYHVDPPSKLFARDMEEERLLPYSHATRCEEWSTLRQMLPSLGQRNRVATPCWGTGTLRELQFSRKEQTRFPHVNSPMTR